ncbi:hypothetical protein [Pontibacter sp. HSC-36F09]|uniref:hypothetical protein n=1 Tax=Pontibacter sp. HSC-36F09 TaxID=2910966 RepID=UPI0020A0CD52|nr:hypothetical protein [Pontibacter sp. HSC-36F09]MCP2045492.1 hypothetical protein [Pontibacter sp. HSC-36F09]
MKTHTLTFPLLGWFFGLVVAAVGVLNLVLVHPVPGLVYLFLSLVYLPPTNDYLKRHLNFSIPVVVKIMLAIVLFMFTLGVSDLGDMLDKALM